MNSFPRFGQATLQKIFLIVAVLPLGANFFPFIQRFPDYDAYKTMFYTWDRLPNINWGPLYIILNQFFKYIGFNYSEFRVLTYLLSTTFLFAAFLLINKKFYKEINFNLYQVIGFIVAIEFLIEFFLIRIRAGLAISVATFAVCIFIANKNYYITFTLLIISYFVHSFSALVFTFILLSAFLANKNFNLRFNKTLIALGFLAILVIEMASEYRGLNSYSQLNVYRFLAISPCTILLFFINIKTNKGNINNINNINNFDKFINNLIALYLAIITGLFFVFIFGALKNSGEGLLRILYIFDVFWIFTLIFTVNRYRLTIAYIAFINSMFFIYSVFIR